jgi:protein-tyrosine phosphatase
MTYRVLFVCLGNICRSPAAEAVFRQTVRRLGIAVDTDSAGTLDIHAGNLPDPRMRAAGASSGYELTSIARGVTPRDLQPGVFDWVVAMDRENLGDLLRLAARQPQPQPQPQPRREPPRIVLLSEFLDVSWPRDVPDPYYGGPEGFERVLDMLEAAMPAMLARLTETK